VGQVDSTPAAFEQTIRFHAERLDPGPDVNIDATTSRCQWLGEPMDYSMAIEGMQFLEAAAAKATAAPS